MVLGAALVKDVEVFTIVGSGVGVEELSVPPPQPMMDVSSASITSREINP